MAFAPPKYQLIGAVLFFFGCWLICLRVETRRINREIDRFEGSRQLKVVASANSRRKRSPERVQPVSWPLHMANPTQIAFSSSRMESLDSVKRKA